MTSDFWFSAALYARSIMKMCSKQRRNTPHILHISIFNQSFQCCRSLYLACRSSLNLMFWCDKEVPTARIFYFFLLATFTCLIFKRDTMALRLQIWFVWAEPERKTTPATISFTLRSSRLEINAGLIDVLFLTLALGGFRDSFGSVWNVVLKINTRSTLV